MDVKAVADILHDGIDWKSITKRKIKAQLNTNGFSLTNEDVKEIVCIFVSINTELYKKVDDEQNLLHIPADCVAAMLGSASVSEDVKRDILTPWIQRRWNIVRQSRRKDAVDAPTISPSSREDAVDPPTIILASHYALRDRNTLKPTTVLSYKPDHIKKPTVQKKRKRSQVMTELQALQVLRRLKKKYKIIDLTLDDTCTSSDKDESEVDAVPPTGRSILEALRSGAREDLLQPLEFGVRCDCGMMLLDTDAWQNKDNRSPKHLNQYLRRNNVSVCILRSKKMHTAEAKLDELANLGQFTDVATTLGWTQDNLSVAESKWNDVLEKLSTKSSSLVELPANLELLETPNSAAAFYSWWETQFVSTFNESLWPFQGENSINPWHLSDDEILKRCRDLLLAGLSDKEVVEQSSTIMAGDLKENTMKLAFAPLIGGEGAPPHIDTAGDLVSADGKTYVLRLALAVGHIIQGIKYFWSLPPKGGHADKYLAFCQSHLPVDMTDAQRRYRQALMVDDEVPPPYQGCNSLGWPSEEDWNKMPAHDLPNHFHAVYSKDGYLVTDGSLHGVINDATYQPAAVACDDMWCAGCSDFSTLKPSSRMIEDRDADTGLVIGVVDGDDNDNDNDNEDGQMEEDDVN